MKQDYAIYPSMIEGESDIIWSHDNAQITYNFDDAHPLDVLANKWTAVSQGRFVSITNNTENIQATITLQGAASEIVLVVVFHSTLHSLIVNGSIFPLIMAKRIL